MFCTIAGGNVCSGCDFARAKANDKLAFLATLHTPIVVETSRARRD